MNVLLVEIPEPHITCHSGDDNCILEVSVGSIFVSDTFHSIFQVEHSKCIVSVIFWALLDWKHERRYLIAGASFWLCHFKKSNILPTSYTRWALNSHKNGVKK